MSRDDDRDEWCHCGKFLWNKVFCGSNKKASIPSPSWELMSHASDKPLQQSKEHKKSKKFEVFQFSSFSPQTNNGMQWQWWCIEPPPLPLYYPLCLHIFNSCSDFSLYDNRDEMGLRSKVMQWWREEIVTIVVCFVVVFVANCPLVTGK